MKNFKQLLSEISKGPNWDPNAFSQDMFTAYVGRKFDPNVDKDIVRKVEPPHIRWMKKSIGNKILWQYGLPKEDPHAGLHLPITHVQHIPQENKIVLHLDSTEYHNDLRDHGVTHEVASDVSKFLSPHTGIDDPPNSKDDIKREISHRLAHVVNVEKIEEFPVLNYGDVDALTIHLNENDVIKAHEKYLNNRSKSKPSTDDEREYPEDWKL